MWKKTWWYYREQSRHRREEDDELDGGYRRGPNLKIARNFERGDLRNRKERTLFLSKRQGFYDNSKISNFCFNFSIGSYFSKYYTFSPPPHRGECTQIVVKSIFLLSLRERRAAREVTLSKPTTTSFKYPRYHALGPLNTFLAELRICFVKKNSVLDLKSIYSVFFRKQES